MVHFNVIQELILSALKDYYCTFSKLYVISTLDGFAFATTIFLQLTFQILSN